MILRKIEPVVPRRKLRACVAPSPSRLAPPHAHVLRLLLLLSVFRLPCLLWLLVEFNTFLVLDVLALVDFSLFVAGLSRIWVVVVVGGLRPLVLGNFFIDWDLCVAVWRRLLFGS
jgi:hypothetical protein